MSDFKPPKPPRPVDSRPQSPRPLGSIRIRSHYRYDRFKGWTLVNGYWRRREHRKSKNPEEQLIAALYAIEQNSRENYAIITETYAALEAHQAWHQPGSQLMRDSSVADRLDASVRASYPVEAAFLKLLVADLDDAALAEVGLRRCEIAR